MASQSLRRSSLSFKQQLDKAKISIFIWGLGQAIQFAQASLKKGVPKQYPIGVPLLEKIHVIF